MKFRIKFLICILVYLLTVMIWEIYDIKKEIQINQKQLIDNELKFVKEKNKMDKYIDDLNKYLDKLEKNNQISNKKIENDQQNLTKKIENNNQNLTKKIENLPNKQKLAKIKLEQTLKQINVMIINKTVGALGSGVSIKYKDKFYILTAGHMVNKKTDELYLYENKTQICRLEIVKWDYFEGKIRTLKNDLLLLCPTNKTIIPIFYTEIADSEPITGTQVYIVGNPMGIEDSISEGRIINYEDNYMYYRDSTYFGNSGGGLYTDDGKLVGIVSHMKNLKPFEDYPDYMIYGAVRLDSIIAFLQNIE